ncbi:MAG: hypothetical protein ACKON8_04440, partial [Planctomycetota bacterium]
DEGEGNPCVYFFWVLLKTGAGPSKGQDKIKSPSLLKRGGIKKRVVFRGCCRPAYVIDMMASENHWKEISTK